MGERGEFETIAALFAPLSRGFPGALDLADDAALIDPPPGERLALTSDMLVAGIHFLPDDPADLIARKLIRVNLSDLAAMGAEPWLVLLGLALPASLGDSWLERFARGLRRDCETFGLHLAGGDTVATSGPLTLSMTALGRLKGGQGLTRAGAEAGDLLFVSGTIGDGALGLRALREDPSLAGLDPSFRRHLSERYHLPLPRISLGRSLHGLAGAVMDVSDGLLADAEHICRSSGVAARIDLGRVPLSSAARAALAQAPELWEDVAAGGDDYELLFTAPPEREKELATLADTLGLPITPIGRMEHGSGLAVTGPDATPWTSRRKGYLHRGG